MVTKVTQAEYTKLTEKFDGDYMQAIYRIGPKVIKGGLTIQGGPFSGVRIDGRVALTLSSTELRIVKQAIDAYLDAEAVRDAAYEALPDYDEDPDAA